MSGVLYRTGVRAVVLNVRSMVGVLSRGKSTLVSEQPFDPGYWVRKAEQFADDKSKIAALALELYHMETEKEAEKRVLETEAEKREIKKEMEIMEHGLKEKTRLLGQRLVYERFLLECWTGLKPLSPADITSVRKLEPNFPTKPAEAKFPTKSIVDAVMRAGVPSIDNIRSGILGTCVFPAARQDLKYGVLSEGVHFPMGQELFVRDDEADDVKKFFKHLANRYSIPAAELNSNYISWFNK